MSVCQNSASLLRKCWVIPTAPWLGWHTSNLEWPRQTVVTPSWTRGWQKTSAGGKLILHSSSHNSIPGLQAQLLPHYCQCLDNLIFLYQKKMLPVALRPPQAMTRLTLPDLLQRRSALHAANQTMSPCANTTAVLEGKQEKKMFPNPKVTRKCLKKAPVFMRAVTQPLIVINHPHKATTFSPSQWISIVQRSSLSSELCSHGQIYHLSYVVMVRFVMWVV